MPSSSSATAKARKSPPRSAAPRKRGVKRSSGSAWQVLLPVALGVLLTLGAARFASILAMVGTQAFTLVFPWVSLVKAPALSLSFDDRNNLAQSLLYAQFPVYGLLMGFVWRGTRSFYLGFISAASAHLLGIVLVLAVSFLH